jgi:hypothetical protein
MLRKILDNEGSVLDRTATAEEMARLIAVDDHGRRPEIVPLQAEKEVAIHSGAPVDILRPK